MKEVYLGDGLELNIYDNHYVFKNHNYSMYLRLYFKDVNEFIDNPRLKHWGYDSNSNNIFNEDIGKIVSYLNENIVKRKYETIDALMGSRCRITTKKKELNKFSAKELIKYIEKKKGEANEVASCS